MRVYLDTNIFIAAFERKDRLSDVLGQVFSAGQAANAAAFSTSELVLSELLVMPFRTRNDSLTAYYRNVISPSAWLLVAAVSKNILITAAQLRADRRGLKTPDAIHLATAMATGCTHFLTEDSDLVAAGGAALGEVIMLRPDEATLTSLIESLAQ